MNKKKLIIIVGIFLGIFLLILIISFLVQKKAVVENKNIPTPTATPTTIPSDVLIVTKTNPPADSKETFLPITEVEFVFNKKVNLSSLKIDVFPEIKINTRQKEDSPLSVFVSPQTTWTPGTTTINIISAVSHDNINLSSVFGFQLKTAYPKTPPSDFETLPKDKKALAVNNLKLNMPYYGTNFTITYDRSKDMFTVFFYNDITSGEKEFSDYLKTQNIENPSWIKNLTKVNR